MPVKNTVIDQPASTKKCLRVAFLAASLALVTACGSGGGDTSSDTVIKAEIKPLDHMSDTQLLRSAATGTKQMQMGVNNAQGFATQPALSDTMNSASRYDLQVLLGMSGESESDSDSDSGSGSGSGGGGGVSTSTGDASFDQYDNDAAKFDSAYSNNDDLNDFDEQDNSVSLWDESGMEQLIDTTLGLIGNADVTRDGNSMTVDPDDNELCQSAALDMQDDFNEMQFCLAMVSDLLVRIDGQTEDSGEISYLFQDETVMQIEYSSGQALYKLRLPGVGRVFEKATQLNPNEFGSMPEVFEGVIELGMQSDNDKNGSEAGAMSIAITAPIAVQHTDAGLNMRLAASNLLNFEHDNASGTASVELDARAFLYSFSDGETIEFAGSGSTVKIDLINDGEQISVSKLGLGNGPLTVTIDSVEVMKMTLDTFGFDIDALAQQLILTGGLNFNLMVNLVGDMFGDAQNNETMLIEATASAPSAAQFSAQPNGSVKLENAGPLVIDWFASFGGASESASFAASPGECFTEGSEGNALFSQVVCQ